MPTVTTFRPNPNFAQRQIHIVAKHYQIRKLKPVKTQYL
jgi:hypothetical protein